jgi:hypothetical protein
VALSELSNATCWFYPTHDGTFLSRERGLGLSLQPGLIVVCPDELNLEPYDRGRISVLWSLLGDNASLTCVGLTYAGQRLDWPLHHAASNHYRPWDGSGSTAKPIPASSSRIASRWSQLSH